VLCNHQIKKDISAPNTRIRIVIDYRGYIRTHST
jgi:hypothetical protein